MRHLAIAMLALLGPGSTAVSSRDVTAPCLITSHSEGSNDIAYERAATLLLRGLPNEDVEALAEILDSIVSNAIAKESDIYVDDSTNPHEALDGWMKFHAREITAAIAFVAPRWRADDGFTVALSQSCNTHNAVSLADDGRDSGRRARFLAWSVSKARVVSHQSIPSDRMGEHVSLVVSAHALANASKAEARVRTLSRSLSRFGTDDRWLTAMAASPSELSLAITPAEGEALLIPDLLALRD